MNLRRFSDKPYQVTMPADVIRGLMTKHAKIIDSICFKQDRMNNNRVTIMPVNSIEIREDHALINGFREVHFGDVIDFKLLR